MVQVINLKNPGDYLPMMSTERVPQESIAALDHVDDSLQLGVQTALYSLVLHQIGKNVSCCFHLQALNHLPFKTTR